MREELNNLIGNSGRVMVGWFDSSPGPTHGDHFCGVEVRVHDYAARFTTERFFISETQAKALMTGLGRVGGADEDKSNSIHRRLIPDKLLKLRECPEGDGAVHVPVWNPCFVPDSLQVFHNNPVASCPDSLRNDLLCEPVILGSHATRIQSTEPFQGAFSAFRAFGLEARADLPPFLAISLRRSAIELFSRGEGGEVSDPKINPENASWSGVWNAILNYDVTVITVLGLNERSRFNEIGSPKSLVLVNANVERGSLSPFMSAEGDFSILKNKGESVRVERDKRGPKFEPSFHSCGFKSSGRTPERGTDEVGREAKFPLDFMVKRTMKPEGICFPVISSPLRNLGAGFRVAEEEFVENRDIDRFNGKLASNCADALHGRTVASNGIRIKLKEEAVLLPPG